LRLNNCKRCSSPKPPGRQSNLLTGDNDYK
jgi:hypothetical protein